MTAALALLLLAGGPADTVADTAAGRVQVYRLTLSAAKLDHFLPPPRQRRVRFELDARRAPPKARVMFRAPLPAGSHHLHLVPRGGSPDHTLVVAVPLGRGPSRVTVRIDGPGRFDFGFFSGEPAAPAKEYRYTVVGPLPGRTFEVDLP